MRPQVYIQRHYQDKPFSSPVTYQVVMCIHTSGPTFTLTIKDNLRPPHHGSIHCTQHARNNRLVDKRNADLLTGPPARAIQVARAQDHDLGIDDCELEVALLWLTALLTPRLGPTHRGEEGNVQVAWGSTGGREGSFFIYGAAVGGVGVELFVAGNQALDAARSGGAGCHELLERHEAFGS
jgi:hypothetical protein